MFEFAVIRVNVLYTLKSRDVSLHVSETDLTGKFDRLKKRLTAAKISQENRGY